MTFARAYTFACLLALGLLLAPPHAQAQRPPSPEALLRGWLSAQAEAAGGLAGIEMMEQTTHVLDGPFGAREVQLEAFIQGTPGTRDWDRDVRSLRIDGQEVGPERRRRLERQRGYGIDRRHARDLIIAMLLPPELLIRMQPTGRVLEAEEDGALYWRLDLLMPEAERLPLERVTLWFTPRYRRLHHSRAILRSPAGPPGERGASLLVTTYYDHLEGLDLPRRRHVEGTLQTKRRMRTFTLLMTVDTTYHDYRFVRGGS